MTRHSYRMALRLTRVTALFLALIVPIRSRAPTVEPEQFEAAFQGRCGEGSPCEQLCRELHDGTFECGCGPGFILHVDGYGCMQLNATKVNSTSDLNEDVIYQKDVSFTAELEIAPQIHTKQAHKQTNNQTHIKTTLPSYISNEINQNKENNERKKDFIATGERSKFNEGISNLIDDGLSRDEVELIEDRKGNGDDVVFTTLGPSLELKVPNTTLPPPWTPAVEKCNCKCGDDSTCSCPQTLARCPKDPTITVPRFAGPSWLALRTLHGAYKRVRIRLRVRPERAKGILLLTGENDDLSGDYLALVLRQGHVELRFECGSGAGVLRTREPVRLGRWNTITVYRHRWDAWLRLNQGRRVSGRSKGLFSRMTFREPVWLGGGGNTTGLESRLGLTDGLLGCVDYLRINGQTYNLMKDSIATYDIGECAPTLAPWKPENELTTLRNNDAITKTDNPEHHIYNINDIVNFEDNDIVMRDAKTKTEPNNSIEQFKKDKTNNFVTKYNEKQEILLQSKRKENNELNSNSISVKGVVIDEVKADDECECQHGGGCVSGVCLCPLGYAGERCEITLDLKVPRFNGSSYLRLPGLGNSAESWLNIQITLKPSDGDGVVLLNSERSNGDGDMFALLLRGYYVEFEFDLGSGTTVVRSASPLERDKWHRVTVNRAGRKATLTVYDIESHSTSISETRSVQSHGGARRLSLHGALYLGGYAAFPSRLRCRKMLRGCVKQLIINDEEIAVVAAALGGVNVDNCDDSYTEDSSYLCKDKKLCSEEPYLPPQLTQNYTIAEPQLAIVPKKGILTKHKKNKTKNNRHTKSKKYKNVAKNIDSNVIVTEKPITKKPIENTLDSDYESYKPVGDETVFEELLLPVVEEFDKSQYLDTNDIHWSDSNSYPSFSGRDSYVHIDDEETIKRLRSPHVEINVRFRSTHHSGLLVWSGGRDGAYLALALIDSTLVFSYNFGSGEVEIVANGTRVDDGLWHRARATRNGQAGFLEVDGQGAVGSILPASLKTQLNTENGLYIGGLPSIEVTTGARYHSGLVGCVSQISLGGDLEIPLSLSSLQHMISSNVARCST